jgi:hypothetical protein
MNTDSGGSSGLALQLCPSQSKMKCTIGPDFSVMQEYQEEFLALCKEMNQTPWYEIYTINFCRVFHFRAMSNWNKAPEEFMRRKKELILKHTTPQK